MPHSHTDDTDTHVSPNGRCSHTPVLPPEGHASLHLPYWGLSCGFLSRNRNCSPDPLHWARRALGAKRSELSSQPLSEVGTGLLPVLLVKELRFRELTKQPHQHQRFQAAGEVSMYLQKVLFMSLGFLILPTLPCEASGPTVLPLSHPGGERLQTTVTGPNPECDLCCPPEAS